ncbi:DGQHR domain-containing protein [Mesorhizobium sp.]|uniref:DGQHR domain-containing protein n=1 Tax=Mesorhizobium sp. TaxID=1871066 RepID=UPI000FE3BFE0|nr:DGQHR domain-containing protein [Mesorhizobium sp.]RWN55441.1 MAG: DGQHR domain-containing protein [Mesorhizobium sp.]RWN77410.1 MAG: DGQHR domain-containing protein [Mesorhizobium sp.]RWN80053.1 MAG: DGQHR domain-containing protein [Mesorhizobium sp.]RWN87312.1 MAG: DGQHR domain-containing protein [Mesorhizobium sp.]RWO15146.1 MAG: DGQHR domain-containing protein [Mesorhizobium sp.]
MDDLFTGVADPDPKHYSFPVIRVAQPVGDIFLASIPWEVITKIAYFDVRRVIEEERDVERYLGIQRPLDPQRVKKLEEYVNFFDASFPTAVIIAVDDKYATYNEDARELTLSNMQDGELSPSIAINNIARVIDGQHRIAGLLKFRGDKFDIPVSIFVGADVADQAQIFSTVNLEQTKVHKNLVYDLYSLARSRSPQKTCHNIAVALDQDNTSPFYRRIKRLGGATVFGRFEPISQATFVESLLKYITPDAKRDRDTLLRGKSLTRATRDEIYRYPFRNLFIDEQDIQIGEEIYKLFALVADRWAAAWNDQRREGLMLNRTNGFRALMRLYGFLFREHGVQGTSLPVDFIVHYLRSVPLDNGDFNTENFVPGSSGEGRLYRVLIGEETL